MTPRLSFRIARPLLWIGLALIVAAAPALAQDLAPAELSARLSSEDPAVRSAAASDAWQAGPAGVAVAGELLESAEPGIAKTAERALYAIAHHCSRPGAAADRPRTSRQLILLLDSPLAPAAKLQVLRVLSVTADDAETVSAIATRLEERELRDGAFFALERISHPSAEEALIAALQHEGVADARTAVIRALGSKQSSQAVPLLLGLARTGNDKERSVAAAALAHIGDARAEALLHESWETARDPAAAQNLLRFAEARIRQQDGATARKMYAHLLTSDAGHLRAAAAHGLGEAGGHDSVTLLIASLEDSSPAVRAECRSALSRMTHGGVSAALLTAWSGASSPTRAQLLHVMADRRQPETPRLVLNALEGADTGVRLAALEVAGRLGDPALASRLVAAVEKGSPAEREMAERSLVSIARRQWTEGERRQALDLYYWLLDQGQSTSAVRDAVHDLGAIGEPASLERIAKLAGRSEYRDAVAEARLSIATALPAHEAETAIEVLEAVCAEAGSRSLRQRAARKLQRLGVDTSAMARRSGFLTSWQLCGPFAAGEGEPFDGHPFGDGGPRIPPAALSPEEAAARPAAERWQHFDCSDVEGIVDLVPLFDPNNNVSAFAYAELDWPSASDAVLKVGSDDGVVMWLNGERVHSNQVSRGVTVDQDRVPVRLQQGTNRLLLKIVNGGGGWGFCLRVCDGDGQPVKLAQ